MPGLTPGGIDFLKCAFAPPDFGNLGTNGVPDEFNGRTVIKRHSNLASLSSATTLDLYYAIMPVPGIAFFQGQASAGSTPLNIQLSPVTYPDQGNIFPNGDEARTMTDFRYLSNVVEIVCTSNLLNASGSIQVWKAKIDESQYILTGTGVDTSAFSLNGGNSIIPTADCFLGSASQGIYAMATQAEPEWEFNPIRVNGQQAMSFTFEDERSMGIYLTSGYTGMGNLDTIFVKIPATASGAVNFIVRSWAVVEYMCSTSSTLADYARPSPAEDKLALEVYRKAISSIPIAVPVHENGTFWATLWQWINPITNPIRGAANFLPGQYGRAARQVNAGLNMLR